MNIPSRSDAEFCGRVPLHQTNLVQPHGYLLVVEKERLDILQASENVGELLGKPVKEVIHTRLQNYIPAGQAEKMQQQFTATVSGRLPFLLSFSAGNHLAVIKQQQSYFILEIEKEMRSAGTDDSFIKVYQDVKYVMGALEEAKTTEETCRMAAEELKKISGFDKVMIYRFDENWNGDVIAEVMEEGMDSYLGLKFPASDIPKQARELYKKMPYRLIPNVDYEPVKLYPVINPATNVFTDLSDSNLRSVAGVHLEYLKNMNVAASMSTRILKDDRLWGLIACHHRTAKHLSFEMCAVFELLSSMISTRISAMQNQDVFQYRTAMQQLHTQLVETVYQEDDLLSGLDKNREELLKLLTADGIAVVMDKNVETFGTVPKNSEITELILWLQSSNANKLYHQPALSSVYEPAEAFVKKASGMLALPIQVEKGHFILAFRPEAAARVNWGGNPSETIHFEADGKKYHPRASFQLWQQEVTKTSVPWKPEELEVAEQFRNFVVEFTFNKL